MHIKIAFIGEDIIILLYIVRKSQKLNVLKLLCLMSSYIKFKITNRIKIKNTNKLLFAFINNAN